MPVAVVPFGSRPEAQSPIEHVYRLPATANDLLLSANPLLAAYPAYWNKDVDPGRFAPVTKLTRGDSFALIGPAGALGKGLAGIAATAPGRSVRVATLGTRSAHGLFGQIVARRGGFPLELIAVESQEAALAQIAAGKADAAIFGTNIFAQLARRHPGLRPLVTSGAKRSPKFPSTPTLAELAAAPKLSFTLALGFFGPPGMPADTVTRIDGALRKAAGVAATQRAAKALGYTLDPLGPDGLTIDLNRDRRIVGELGSA
jgi:tripartite-type tricarboxylate transporter receptor subunit TctC